MAARRGVAKGVGALVLVLVLAAVATRVLFELRVHRDFEDYDARWKADVASVLSGGTTPNSVGHNCAVALG